MHPKTLQTILVLFLWTISFQNQLAHGDDDLVTQQCEVTTSFATCTECVKAHGGDSTSTDIGIVQTVMVCAAKDMSTLYHDGYEILQQNPYEALNRAVTVCLDKVESVQGLVGRVAERVNSRDFNGAKGFVLQILEVVSTCNVAARAREVDLPKVLVDDLYNFNRGWNGIVLKMLDFLH